MLVNRVLAVVIAGLLSVAGTASAAAAAPPTYGVTEVSETYWYTDSTFTAVGEVRNDTDVPVRNVKIRVTLLDAGDAVVATAFGEAWLLILDPGETSSYRVDLARPSEFAKYRVEVDDWSYTSLPANHYFTATVQAAVATRSTRLTGTVTNGNVVLAGGIVVVATLRDGDGTVVGSGAVALPGGLVPGASAPFDLSVAHVATDGDPAVSIVAESTSDPRTTVTFGVDPTDLPYGRKVVVHGTAPDGSTVTFERFDQAAGRWEQTPDEPVAVGSDGSYKVTVKPAVGTTYRAVAGDVASVPVVVYVRVSVTLRASTKAAAIGAKVTLTGRARPADPGSKVVIQRKVGDAWKPVATGSISSSTGAYTVGWRPKAAGTYVLRALVGDQALVFPGASSSLSIVVR
jgi:hypothetical protein